jgi:hypothetical protein
MKKITKKEIAAIIKRNPLIDKTLLLKSQQQLRELQKMSIQKSEYNLVLPYSRRVRVTGE